MYTERSSISFEGAASYYDTTRGFSPDVAEKVTQALARVIPSKNSRNLEIGIGTGRIAFPLITEGYNFTGVDVSISMMSRLREKILYSFSAPAKVSLIQGDVTRLPFLENSFDTAMEVHVLHLVPAWQDAFYEIRRVVRPGGAFIHGYTSGQHTQDVWSPWTEVRCRWRNILAEIGHPIDWVGTKTDEELIDLMKEEGVNLKQLEPIKWVRSNSFGAAMGFLEDKCFSDTWNLPEPIFAEAIRRLKLWAEQERLDLEQVYDTEHRFIITVATL